MRQRSGFTMIEVLLMIANLSALGSINAVGFDPAHQISLANNAQRRFDLNAILTATQTYMIDHRGRMPANITSKLTPVCRYGVTPAKNECLDLSVLTNDLMYLPDLPVDPLETSLTKTGYWIARTTTTSPRITVSAPRAELGETIKVTR